MLEDTDDEFEETEPQAIAPGNESDDDDMPELADLSESEDDREVDPADSSDISTDSKGEDEPLSLASSFRSYLGSDFMQFMDVRKSPPGLKLATPIAMARPGKKRAGAATLLCAALILGYVGQQPRQTPSIPQIDAPPGVPCTS